MLEVPASDDDGDRPHARIQLGQRPFHATVTTVHCAWVQVESQTVLAIQDLPMRLDLTRDAIAALRTSLNTPATTDVVRVTVSGSAREVGLVDTFAPGTDEDDWFLDLIAAGGAYEEPAMVAAAAQYVWSSGLERRRIFVVGTRRRGFTIHMHRADEHGGEVGVASCGGDSDPDRLPRFATTLAGQLHFAESWIRNSA